MGEDPPTERLPFDLNDFQRKVLIEYAVPMSNGRGEPATHREVATRLSFHPNTVRETLYDIWTHFFEMGVPMIDVDDKRVAVVEAARLHGIL
jgi:hypothetical protein